MPPLIPPTPRLRPIPLPRVVIPSPSWAYPGGLPSPTTPSIQLHEILRPSSPPRLYYDVSEPPSTIVFDPQSTPCILAMDATTPPVTCFRIMLPTIPPLPVVVHNLRGVTIFDVLNGLYRSLHSPSSASHWDELDGPHCASSHDPPTHPHSCPSGRFSKSEGARKIDYLDGRTTFAGLEPGHDWPDSWDLHTTE